KALEDPALLSQVIEATRSFSWTRGYVSAAGWLDWLTTLPLEVRLTLPDGTRVLGVHAAPGRDDGPGLHAKHSEGELEKRLAGWLRSRRGNRGAYPCAARSADREHPCHQSGQCEQSGHARLAGDLCASGGRRTRLQHPVAACGVRSRGGYQSHRASPSSHPLL